MKEGKTIALFDGTNVWKTCRMLDFTIDFGKTRKYLQETYDILRVYYFTAITDNSHGSTMNNLVTFLDHNGYTTVTKPGKYQENALGEGQMKGNMDTELCCYALRAAYNKQCDHILLWSGDGDFTKLVEHIQDLGILVTVFSSTSTSPIICADQLRRQADIFVDLQKIRQHLFRE